MEIGVVEVEPEENIFFYFQLQHDNELHVIKKADSTVL